MAMSRLRRPRLASGAAGPAAVLVRLAAGVVPAQWAEAETSASTSGGVAASAAPLPRIVSRQDGLYNAATGAPFVARRANYTRLATNAAGNVFHSTFEPGRYDRAKVIAFLEQMRHDGYNTARVFIDHGSGGGDHGIGRGLGPTTRRTARTWTMWPRS